MPKCEDCYYHDPFEGEETIWFEILLKQKDKCRCGLGFTFEETVIGPLGHLVGKNQSCPEHQYPKRVD